MSLTIADTLGRAAAAAVLALALGHASAADEAGTTAAALRHVSPSTVLWTLPFVAALAFLDLWCAHGLYSGGQAHLSRSCMAIVAAAALTLPRNRVARSCADLVPGPSKGKRRQGHA